MKETRTKVKKVYPEDAKSMIGFSLISWVQGFATVVFSLFMQYLTDYSGIDSAIGKVGYAAAFGTVILLITRIVDAVDDPLQAWIMDSARENKFGKYRRFTLASVFLIAVGIVMMFTLPAGVRGSRVLLPIWVLVGYFLFEMGSAFNGIYGIIQKSTSDAGIRTKIMSLLRMAIILSVIPASFFIPIATAANSKIHNMGRSFSICMVFITAISAVISLIGIVLVKEPYFGNQAGASTEKKDERLSGKDVWNMLKHNGPLWAHNIGYFFLNAAYPISAAILVYFLKWYYCADYKTGVVDNAMYAKIYGIYGAISLVPAFLTPLLAGIFIKQCKTIDKAQRVCAVASGIGYLIMFVLFVTGILHKSPLIFIVLMFLIALPSNISTIPSQLLGTEAADYAEYITGKNMTSLTMSVQNMLGKAQNAIAAVIPGAILIAVGYSVNAKTGNYAGDLSLLPGMVNKLTLIFTLVPALVSFIGWFIYRKFYKVTPALREEMAEELQKRHSEAGNVAANEE